MSVEGNVAEILANLEERRLDKWGQQAGRVAAGIAQSGLVDRVDAASDRMQVGLTAIASVIGVATATITAEIALSNSFLNGIADTLRNPLATAADERYRRGINALNKSWLPEAVSEFTAAIGTNPYFAPAHAALGIAHANNGSLPDAVASFRLAVRYATPDEPQIAAGCGLLAASALDDQGKRNEAAALLRDLKNTYPNCAEVALTYARLSGDRASVKDALWLAPELAIPAMAGGAPGLDVAADELAGSRDGPVLQAIRLRNALTTFVANIYNPSMPQLPPRALELERLSVPDAMTVAGELLNSAKRISTFVDKAFIEAVGEDGRRHAAGKSQTDLAATQKAAHSAQRQQAEKEFSHARSRRDGLALVIGAALVGATVLLLANGPEQPATLGGYLPILLAVGCLLLAFAASGSWPQENRILRKKRSRLNDIGKWRPAAEASARTALPASQTLRRSAVEELHSIAKLRENRLHPWSQDS